MAIGVSTSYEHDLESNTEGLLVGFFFHFWYQERVCIVNVCEADDAEAENGGEYSLLN